MELPEGVHRLSAAFQAAGFELYVVGGAVRDAVLGLAPKDIDLATNAVPDQVSKIILGMLGYGTDEVGKSFGVIRARIPLSEIRSELHKIYEYEIATFREDMSSGRHPEVRFATINEDVQRRDLTMNALFYDIQTNEIVDLVGGMHDLQNGIVDTVGRPQDRFAEDRLRILRAVRFATRFGYPMSHRTEQAILDDPSLTGISPERIRDEFVRSIASAKDTRVLLGLYDYFGLWTHVMPTLKVSTIGVPHVKDTAVILACILAENSIEDVARVLNLLKYSDVEIKQTTFLMRLRTLKVDNAFRLNKAAHQAHINEEQIRDYTWMTLCDAATLEAFIAYQPTVKGDDLLAEGYSGRALGVELERRETELFERLVRT
jgi:tRNA nucleotidyltransferase/poly(A) polymerase